MATIVPITPTSVNLTAGQAWSVGVRVAASAGVPTGVVSGPDGEGTPLTLATSQYGGPDDYYGAYLPLAAGRYLATLGTPDGAITFQAYVTDPAASGPPVLEDLVGDRTEERPGYLGLTSWSDADVMDALEAELAAQRRVCRIPAAYGADLRQAAMRRVARNLSLRRLPLAVLRGDAEGGETTALPGTDPEIRRLERPYRRVKVG